MLRLPLSPSHVAKAQRVLAVAGNRSSSSVERVREAFLSPVPALLNALDGRERERFVNDTLPYIARRAMSLPSCLDGGALPTLHGEGEVTLSRATVASLLSSMFLDLLPAPPVDWSFNTFSMNSMLNLAPSGSVAAKIHCLVHYFERLAAAESQPSAHGVWVYPMGAVVYRRVRVASPPDYAASAASLVPLYAHVDGGIEDQGGALMVDFANKFIGGGVLRRGAVQEEIAFVQNPELLASCALMSVMRDDEAIVMTGAEQFSQTTGYGRTLTWSAPAEDRTPRWRDPAALVATTHTESSSDLVHVKQIESGLPRDLLLRCVVAIDAQPYMLLAHRDTAPVLSHDEVVLLMQLRREEMDRELTKALAGFSVDHRECSLALFPAVSTGRWGCGVFGGDDQLKSLLQWIAASISRRELHVYTFGGAELAADLAWAMDTVRVKGSVTAGQLYTALLSFASEYGDGSAPAGAKCGAGAAGARRVPIIRLIISRL